VRAIVPAGMCLSRNGFICHSLISLFIVSIIPKHRHAFCDKNEGNFLMFKLAVHTAFHSDVPRIVKYEFECVQSHDRVFGYLLQFKT
jgi:hypothetical protein